MAVLATEVIAVRDQDNAVLLDAIMIQTTKRRRFLIEWWGGYASQTLADSVRPEDVSQWPGWRAFTMELPKDWEEGYLRSVDGRVEFIYGEPPKKSVDN